MEALNFWQGDCHITIYPNKLPDLPLSNIRKIFKLMLSEPWSNEDAIHRMPDNIAQELKEAKAKWHEASVAYHDGWRIVDKPKSRTPSNVEILNENKRLTTALKKAKAHFDRWQKIQIIWEEAQA